MKQVLIFASGAGSNAEKIIHHFQGHSEIKVAAVFSNQAKAGVCTIANSNNIPLFVFNRNDFYNSTKVLDEMKKYSPALIVLAGFLWMVPQNILEAYPDSIINIHPSLLPAYGGAGMYGMHVHEAVIQAQENFSGITIHRVNAEFDKGKILFQEKIKIEKDETAESLAAKIRMLELKNYSAVIETLLV